MRTCQHALFIAISSFVIDLNLILRKPIRDNAFFVVVAMLPGLSIVGVLNILSIVPCVCGGGQKFSGVLTGNFNLASFRACTDLTFIRVVASFVFFFYSVL